MLVGVAGAVDWERRFDAGGKRPVLHAAADPYWPNPELHHPADIPLHLREQADGHHSASECQDHSVCAWDLCFLLSHKSATHSTLRPGPVVWILLILLSVTRLAVPVAMGATGTRTPTLTREKQIHVRAYYLRKSSPYNNLWLSLMTNFIFVGRAV